MARATEAQEAQGPEKNRPRTGIHLAEEADQGMADARGDDRRVLDLEWTKLEQTPSDLGLLQYPTHVFQSNGRGSVIHWLVASVPIASVGDFLCFLKYIGDVETRLAKVQAAACLSWTGSTPKETCESADLLRGSVVVFRSLPWSERVEFDRSTARLSAMLHQNTPRLHAEPDEKRSRDARS